MLDSQIFTESGGILAHGRSHLATHTVIQISRAFAKANVTLNRHELAALIESLTADLTGTPKTRARITTAQRRKHGLR